jgi:hypothetical protein
MRRIDEAVNSHVEGKQIVLSPVKARPRQGWEAKAKRMHEAGDDALLFPDVFSDEVLYGN